MVARITGTSGPDILTGHAYTTIIDALGGDDVLTGGRSNDYLYAGDGDDRLWGAGGRDILWGGSGDDTFVFKKGDGSYDYIQDFSHDDDTIEVHGYGLAPALHIAYNGSIYVNGDLIAVDVHHSNPALAATAADFVFLP